MNTWEVEILKTSIEEESKDARSGVVVFDGTAPEKTGPKDGTKYCGPRKMLQT